MSTTGITRLNNILRQVTTLATAFPACKVFSLWLRMVREGPDPYVLKSTEDMRRCTLEALGFAKAFVERHPALTLVIREELPADLRIEYISMKFVTRESKLKGKANAKDLARAIKTWKEP